MGRHEGRRVLVTGAGSGIGRAVARQIAAEGGVVVSIDVHAEPLEALADEVRSTGGEISTIVVDLADAAAVEAAVAAIVSDGPIDLLANVAGIMDAFVPLHAMEDELWRQVMAVNLDAPMRLVRAVLPGMRAAGRGAIVNVTSKAGSSGGPAGAAYVASKHALIGLTRSVAARYGRDGIRSNAVAPGGVATGIATTATPRDPAEIDAWMPSIGAAPAPGQPEDISGVICWLGSDEARHVNGVVLPADSGWSVL